MPKSHLSVYDKRIAIVLCYNERDVFDKIIIIEDKAPPI